MPSAAASFGLLPGRHTLHLGSWQGRLLICAKCLASHLAWGVAEAVLHGILLEVDRKGRSCLLHIRHVDHRPAAKAHKSGRFSATAHCSEGPTTRFLPAPKHPVHFCFAPSVTVCLLQSVTSASIKPILPTLSLAIERNQLTCRPTRWACRNRQRPGP